MEILNFSHIGKMFKHTHVFIWIGFFILAGASSCSTLFKRRGTEPQQNSATAPTSAPTGTPTVLGPPEPFGPSMPQAFGPIQSQIRPVILVFGPGLASGFAAVGVIRALHENKIPIGAIYAAEAGALVGALYALDGNINHFEFQLLKYKASIFDVKRSLIDGLLNKGPSSGGDFQNELKKSFGQRDISSTKIPLRIALHIQESNVELILDQGAITNAVRASLASPKVFTPGKFNGSDAIAAEKSGSLLVDQAKALGSGPVLAVDTEIFDASGADLVVKPNFSDLNELDFDQETEFAFRGKKAALDVMSQLRQQVGLGAVEQ